MPRWTSVFAAVLLAGPANLVAGLGNLPSGFSDEAIVTRYQHWDVYPVSMAFLPDRSGRYLLADKHGFIWIGDIKEDNELTVYMHLTDTFSKDEVSSP